jgi:hypothetical protein
MAGGVSAESAAAKYTQLTAPGTRTNVVKASTPQSTSTVRLYYKATI